ncbi:rCG21814 [Rattus norvegicus]|uniref:RCG21814 n=1 Tax=Rattus norvegicus TaxID=10116 RepID=A6J1Y8_RAT|nr:rCG21814 [Rattus norvegicus]
MKLDITHALTKQSACIEESGCIAHPVLTPHSSSCGGFSVGILVLKLLSPPVKPFWNLCPSVMQ